MLIRLHIIAIAITCNPMRIWSQSPSAPISNEPTPCAKHGAGVRALGDRRQYKNIVR